MTRYTTKASPKRASTLSERMKKGELYVCYGGLSDGYMSLVSYGDSNRIPRIYGKDAVDDRLGNSLSICRNMATAQRVLRGKTQFVMLPLSEMVFVWGERRVKRWAKVQGHVNPNDVRKYIKKCVAKKQAT